MVIKKDIVSFQHSKNISFPANSSSGVNLGSKGE